MRNGGNGCAMRCEQTGQGHKDYCAFAAAAEEWQQA